MARKYTPLSWKKNFRKIPPRLYSKIRTINNNDVVVACVKKVSKEQIANGILKHLGIELNSQGVVFPDKIMPLKTIGIYSKANIEGKEIKRKDLPMITKTFVVESPNFGDWSNGSHDTYFDRDVYVKEYIPPKQLELKIHLLSDDGQQLNDFLLKFSIDEVLRKTSETFMDDLFFNINLMQENIGNADIYPSDATFEDFAKTLYVDWEILPIGERDSDIKSFALKFGVKSKENAERLRDRYDLLTELDPIEFISGSSGFRRYFGAKFSENLIVFENLEYGNAVYVMYEDWRELSRKSRFELLKGDSRGFDRVIHTKNWKMQLRFLIEEARKLSA